MLPAIWEGERTKRLCMVGEKEMEGNFIVNYISSRNVDMQLVLKYP